MPLNVLTYDVPFHKKTYDTLSLLKASGYDAVCVYALPLHYKKAYTPLVFHRPGDYSVYDGFPSCRAQCESFSYEYVSLTSTSDLDCIREKLFLVCGAGILPECFIHNNTVINAHPGYIPDVRGLDALKWAIFMDKPIGVTTHLIGDEVDAGKIIERRMVPVFKNDSFHAVAQRQYDMEIQMLVSAVEKLGGDSFVEHGGGHEIHQRMPHEYEKRLADCFARYISEHAISRQK